MTGLIQLIARILLALIFIMAGIGKIIDPAGTSGYMDAMGVPSILLWPTIALELLGGIAIAIGYKTSIAAFALAVFSIAAAILFHHDFADKMQMILFMKNLAMAGGLLLLAVGPTTAFSFDMKKKKSSFFGTKQ